MQAYSDPRRANDPHALPDLEVWQIRDTDKGDAREYTDDEGETVVMASGWYYWFCLPGCMPNSTPIGPFASSDEALLDAREGEDFADELEASEFPEAFEYTLSAEPEDDDPEGHFATGDDEADAKLVEDIRDEREWNVWAWCVVKVSAHHPEIEGLEGTDYLGACSYTDAEDFKTGGYYEQMKDEAARSLVEKIKKVYSVAANDPRLQP